MPRRRRSRKLRFVSPDDPRIVATIGAVRPESSVNGYVLRYRQDDVFGR
jgi:GH15 family glucan-1,4-alpha-glucosidase